MPSRRSHSISPRLWIASAAALIVLIAATPVAANEITDENAQPGNPPSEWEVSGAGDLSIQGFATDISVDQGGTIHFKIDTDADAYHIDIYRLGWYGGLGARKITTVLPSVTLPQVQPAPITDAATGLTDCGNWSESASWLVPTDATSGVYIARLVREDTDGASHIAFIVRDDDGESDILFQTSETTWQAYNTYGGNSLYAGASSNPPMPRAHKVSFNRPFVTRGGPSEDWVFNAEFPMIRWLERNGYDVSYFTDTDCDRRGAELLEHQLYLSVGHDEYWSAGHRASVAAARDAGVDLAFLSGNEIYWKVRWEPSVDVSATAYRTMVCYKEGTLGEIACGGKCDPLPDVWTGLWRDGCASSPPADGCNPENSLSGQISWDGSTGAIQVPDTYKSHRLWRNTSIAGLGAGQTATLSANTLGYEWDWEQYPASVPAGRVALSLTNFNSKTHKLSLYRHASGALVFGAGTVQWSWGLDGTHDRGASTPDARMQQATVNLFAEMGALPTTLQGGLTAVTATGDVTAPVSSIGFPIAAGHVSSGASVTISGTAADAAGVIGGVEVSTDGGATWAPAQGGENWTFAWTPGAPGAVTLKSRAADDLGNLETPSAGISVTVDAGSPTCPCTIWSPATVGGTDGYDGQAIENGVRFRADVDGFIEGIRFYKNAANTGTHVGKLYTNGGTPLASVTFTGESASGWQEMLFGSPVAITAGTTYVASLFSAGGHYAYSNHYFQVTGQDNAPLHALAQGVDGDNGVYVYTPTGAFPNQTFQEANYWVDVRFNTATGPDETPPQVTGITPGSGASGVAVGANVTAVFSEALDPLTVDGTTFELHAPGDVPVPAAVSWTPGSRTATLDPDAALAHSTTYTATLHGGATDPRLEDLASNALAASLTWSFTTAAPPPPPPTEGPGGPILVISAAANPFSRYFAEILRAEGFNAFTAMDLSLVTPAVLAAYDVAILGETPLSAGEVTMVSDWVTAGGNLIAMRPDAQLAPLLGLSPAGGTLANAYVLMSGAGPSAGIVGQTIQYHGAADRWTAAGATVLSTLYSDAVTATPYAGATLRSVGGSGGQAACFTYDLARSVVYTRQGNPAWAGQERDAPEGPVAAGTLRASDMFYGNAPGDPQPDWVDLTKVQIPQADEQQRLLANLILSMNLDRKPLPRFWYFPSGKKAVVIMTGDNHGDGGMASRFTIYNNQSPPGCSVDDWECVRASGYMYVSGSFTDAQALAFHNQGHEVGIHVNTNCNNWDEPTLRGIFDTQLATYASAYPSLPPQVSNRTHCGAWSDWVTEARVQVDHGIRLDTNYYYWPPTWVQDRPGMFTGSGIPMRFADLDGSMIDCFQATTQMTDESGQSYPGTVNTLLDRALGAEGYYGAFCANMHFDSSPHTSSDQIVASAQARGVPVVSGRQMLTWLDGRNGSSFANLAWSGNLLEFDVAVGSGARNLRGMLPRISAVGPLNALTRNGSPVAYTTETIKGIEYAVFPADAGSYDADYSPDAAPPAISSVVATPVPGGTATITWTTDEPSDSRVDYGTSPALGSTVTLTPDVTSHSVPLSGLLASTTYYYRVTSEDPIGNSATSPNPPAAPASFVTAGALCFADDVDADFGAGSHAGTYVAHTDDGEVILAPVVGSEFDGVAVPAGWGSFPWGGGGASTVAGGSIAVDGARANSLGATYGPGLTLEFVATFGASPFQAIGMGGGGDVSPGAIYDGPPWVMFSTGTSGAGVQARTHNGSLSTDETIPGVLLGTTHRFRIDWNPASVDYYVDGVLVTTHAIAVAGPMRPAISDFNVGGPAVTVDWLRMGPYPSAGTFQSRVFDGASNTDWGVASWSSMTPAGTSVAISVRTGNTAIPDGTWTAYLPLASSGASVGSSSRYIQYRAELATTNPAVTPALEDMDITCSPAGPDLNPPLITDVQATPAPNGTEATVTWTTDEPADSRVDYGLTTALGSSASVATLLLSHSVPLSGLLPGTTYYYRVRSADASTNVTVEPNPPAAPLSFVTAPAVCAADDTDADFGAGTGIGTYVAHNTDGELIPAPALGEEFSGGTLPPSFGSFPWSGGGGAVVGGGSLTVDGSCVHSLGAGFTAGSSFEFVATFGATPFQHVGFGSGGDGAVFNAEPIAIFSTGGGGTQVMARTGNGGGLTETGLGAALLGTPHRYRIAWNAGSVDYYVDGVLAVSHPVAIGGTMRPAASDFNVGGGTVSVDWLRMPPYAGAATFESRIFDAGSPVTWSQVGWTSTEPPGAALTIATRTGDTGVPDGTWTPYVVMGAPGASVGITSRYLQWRATFTTPGSAAQLADLPRLDDLSVNCFQTPSVTVQASVTNCLTALNPVVAVPFGVTRIDAVPARSYSVTFQLDPNLMVSGGVAGITEGSYLSSIGSTTFSVIDNGGGSYTVNAAIVGEPCGATATNGTLFNAAVAANGPDGLRTISVASAAFTSCAGAPIAAQAGDPASLNVDTAGPTAVANLLAAPGASGAAAGTRMVALTFTPPPDAATVEVWRRSFGGYPQYDEAGGAVPPVPASYPPAGWTLTSITASGQSDDPGARDQWFYVVYGRDACGNATVSNRTSGTLSYRLGDVHNGVANCAGDGTVGTSDISFLGSNYGITIGTSGALECLDVGPTTDGTVEGRPTTDNRTDFEDFILYAINYGLPPAAGSPSLTRAMPAAAAANELRLRLGETPSSSGDLVVALELSGTGAIQGLSAELSYDAEVVEFLGVEAGPLLAAQADPGQVLSPREGVVDLAVFGARAGLSGTGDVARVRFHMKGPGDPKIAIARVEARDHANRAVTMGTTAAETRVIPARSGLAAARPSPFGERTTLECALARDGEMTLAIFGVDGRRVRTLASGTHPAGIHRLVWDGRDDGGSSLAAGVYWAKLITPDGSFTRKLVRIR